MSTWKWWRIDLQIEFYLVTLSRSLVMNTHFVLYHYLQVLSWSQVEELHDTLTTLLWFQWNQCCKISCEYTLLLVPCVTHNSFVDLTMHTCCRPSFCKHGFMWHHHLTSSLFFFFPVTFKMLSLSGILKASW